MTPDEARRVVARDEATQIEDRIRKGITMPMSITDFVDGRRCQAVLVLNPDGTWMITPRSE